MKQRTSLVHMLAQMQTECVRGVLVAGRKSEGIQISCVKVSNRCKKKRMVTPAAVVARETPVLLGTS
jgi:hypothetical protein